MQDVLNNYDIPSLNYTLDYTRIEMTRVFNAGLVGKTKDPFKHDRKFVDLNQDQK